MAGPRDPYSVLGVARSATAEEIKAAYRGLARRLHPDVNKAPDAAERFAEVQAAYEILSDAGARAEYDRFGRVGVGRRSERQGRGGGAASGGQPFDMDDLGSIFETFFSGRGEGFAAAARGGPHARAKPRRGADVRVQVTADFELACRGGGYSIRMPTDGPPRSVEVRLPAGIADGSTLRVRGEGSASPTPGGSAGDLLVEVRVAPHPIFRRGRPGVEGEAAARSADLWLELPLTIAEATLGASVDVPTLTGPVLLTVPAGTDSGALLRLRGRGIQMEDGRTGDLYARARVVTPASGPEQLPEALRKALEQWGRTAPSPRNGAGWPE